MEVNCQTDFVAKDSGFQAMGQKIVEIAATQKIADVYALESRRLRQRRVRRADHHQPIAKDR
ncbi:hypothetical protein ACNKHQ_00975 [Shigella flexneri]